MFLCITQWNKFFRIVIPSTSMKPTLNIGDQLLVHKIQPENVKRGDIIVFSKDNTLYVKRVIGIPGDIVNIENGIVYVNGCPIQEPYLGETDLFNGTYYVPERSLFVLGDNRGVSFDARYWDYPFINYDSVLGKAVLFLYPKVRFVEEVFYEIF